MGTWGRNEGFCWTVLGQEPHRSGAFCRSCPLQRAGTPPPWREGDEGPCSLQEFGGKNHC